MNLFSEMLVRTGLAGTCIPVGASLARIGRIRRQWPDRAFRQFAIAFGGGLPVGAVALVLVPDGPERLAGLFGNSGWHGKALRCLWYRTAMCPRSISCHATTTIRGTTVPVPRSSSVPDSRQAGIDGRSRMSDDGALTTQGKDSLTPDKAGSIGGQGPGGGIGRRASFRC